MSLVLCVVLTSAACSGSSDEPITTTTAVDVEQSTTTSSSSTSTTSTSIPIDGFEVRGLDGDLGPAVQNVYDVASGEGDSSLLTDVMTAALSEANPIDGAVAATVATGEVLGDSVAVVEIGQDFVLLVDSGTGWRVVGFDLPTAATPAILGMETRHVFIVGSDARPGENAAEARADSLHVVSSAPSEESGAIVGIPRDAWVADPAGRNRKFTDILALQGPEALLETAQGVTDLELEGYLLTGFAGFVDLIDAFGTFEVDIPINMSDRASRAYFTAGNQEIGGADALAFARNRTIPGGDFTRQLHGGVIINWMGRAVQDMGIGQLPALLEILTAHTITDLNAEQLLTMSASLYGLDFEETPNVVVPGSVGEAGSASVVFLGDGAQAIFEDLADGSLDAP